MTVCGQPELAGGRCELEEGHDGPHQLGEGDRIFRWTDASLQDTLDRYGNTYGT